MFARCCRLTQQSARRLMPRTVVDSPTARYGGTRGGRRESANTAAAGWSAGVAPLDDGVSGIVVLLIPARAPGVRSLGPGLAGRRDLRGAEAALQLGERVGVDGGEVALETAPHQALGGARGGLRHRQVSLDDRLCLPREVLGGEHVVHQANLERLRRI